jgi:excisionase family DNA binding protein
VPFAGPLSPTALLKGIAGLKLLSSTVPELPRFVKLKKRYCRKRKKPTSLTRFWDKPNIAEYLGVSIYTIDAWVSQKRIPFLKIGGRKVVFDKMEIDKWIDEQRVEPILEDKGLDF